MTLVRARTALKLFLFAHISCQIQYSCRTKFIGLAVGVLLTGTFSAQAGKLDIIDFAILGQELPALIRRPLLLADIEGLRTCREPSATVWSEA